MNRQIVTALCVVWMGVCIVSALVRGHTQYSLHYIECGFATQPRIITGKIDFSRMCFCENVAAILCAI